MMPQGKGMRGNGGSGGGGNGGRRVGRAPYSSSQEGIEAFDGPRSSAADTGRSDEADEVDDGHRHDHRDHNHQGTANVQEGEALRGRFSYLDIADRVKSLLTNADDHVRQQQSCANYASRCTYLNTQRCLARSLESVPGIKSASQPPRRDKQRDGHSPLGLISNTSNITYSVAVDCRVCLGESTAVRPVFFVLLFRGSSSRRAQPAHKCRETIIMLIPEMYETCKMLLFARAEDSSRLPTDSPLGRCRPSSRASGMPRL